MIDITTFHLERRIPDFNFHPDPIPSIVTTHSHPPHLRGKGEGGRGKGKGEREGGGRKGERRGMKRGDYLIKGESI